MSSLTVTLVAVVGGLGVLAGRQGSQPGAAAVAGASASTDSRAESGPTGSRTVAPSILAEANHGRPISKKSPASPSASASEVALPVDSGEGRRAVFSEGQQRVWLVDDAEAVERTYRVSGSVYDNLDPGTYQVYSRSEDAWGVDGSSMHYFVRFTKGVRAAIGFHTIPELGGAPVQAPDELGTPLSHGCIRQDLADALVMWDFAQLGTTVVVTP